MMPRGLILLAAVCISTSAGLPARAACIDVEKIASLTFEGRLTYQIFPGPPNYEDIRKGDTPEPTYLLILGNPICVVGDDFLDPNTSIDRIQVYPSELGPSGRTVSNDLRHLIGQRVVIEGTSAFGAHTGHHHAPLLMPTARVTVASDPTSAYGTSMTVVQAFYLALGAGRGDEAAQFVVPEKRSSGPLSAAAISEFYSKLVEPLSTLDIVPVHTDGYRVRYTYVAPGPRRCNGEALVRTTKIGRKLDPINKSTERLLASSVISCCYI
jgi:hypothetical protein